jgi:hypothetical protein
MSNNNLISNTKILELWRNPNFSGSYLGIKSFQILLKTDLGIDVSENRLYKVLKTDPIYLIHLRPQRKFERRHYDLRFYGELIQADLAFMFPYKDFKYFLLVTDCYSSKVFVEPLKSKESKEVSIAFKKILDEFKAKVYEIQTDSGSEFKGLTKKLFINEKIVFKQKFGKNKASFSEALIFKLKRRLFLMLRANLSHNWVKYIQYVVNGHNDTPIKKLGWLKPNQIHSEFDSTLVESQKQKFNIKTYHEPDFETQRKLQLKHKDDKKKLQIGDFVYLDLNEKLFDKSFDIQVTFIYI